MKIHDYIQIKNNIMRKLEIVNNCLLKTLKQM